MTHDPRTQADDQAKRQNRGYDEAARGGPGVPPSDVGVPLDADDHLGAEETDPAAQDAAAEVRRRERSAD